MHPSTVCGLSIPVSRLSELHETPLPVERSMFGTSRDMFDTFLPDRARSLSAPPR